jgi:hypothetical protein
MFRMRAFQPILRGAVAAVVLLAVFDSAPPAVAQDREYVPVASPYQEDFAYRIGTDLQPRVEVDGVRWIRLNIQPKHDRQYERTKPAPITVEVDLLNNGDNADVLVIVLFEDENGASLDRLELDVIKAGQDRLREVVQKHKITASVLEDTRRLYVFFEVTR